MKKSVCLRKNKFICSIFLVTCIAVSLHGCTKVKFSGADKPYSQALPTSIENGPRRLALVLGGGGAKGMAHVGILEELANAGIKPDVIIGCSAGAIVGGLYAANPDINALKTLALAGKKSHIIEMSINTWPYSIYNQDKLATYLSNHIAQHDFKDLKIPLLIVATNLEFGNQTVFSQGAPIQAILASAAVPGAFAPVNIHGQYFVDCGVTDPVPVRVAQDLGYETIVAVNIAEQLPKTAPNHLFGMIKRSSEIAYINQCKYATEGADVVIDFDFNDIGIFNDEHNETLYKAGKYATKKAIPLIKEKLALADARK